MQYAGNLRTTDKDGPYKLEALNTSAAHVKAGLAARKDFSAHCLQQFADSVHASLTLPQSGTRSRLSAHALLHDVSLGCAL